MIALTASLICSIVTFIMSLFQLSLTLGAPFGEYALGGSYRVLPKRMRFLSSGFSFAFAFVGLAYLQKGKVFDLGLNSTFVNTLVIVNTLFLAYAIIGNGFLTKSKKERYVMTPISIIQFVCSTAVLFF